MGNGIIYRSGWRQALSNVELRAFDVELRALILIALAGSIGLTWLMHSTAGLPWKESLSQSLLLGFSAQTTAGFSNLQVAELDPASKLLLMGMMTVGGGVGSTAGGIKMLRLLVFFTSGAVSCATYCFA